MMQVYKFCMIRIYGQSKLHSDQGRIVQSCTEAKKIFSRGEKFTSIQQNNCTYYVLSDINDNC